MQKRRKFVHLPPLSIDKSLTSLSSDNTIEKQVADFENELNNLSINSNGNKPNHKNPNINDIFFQNSSSSRIHTTSSAERKSKKNENKNNPYSLTSLLLHNKTKKGGKRTRKYRKNKTKRNKRTIHTLYYFF